MSSTFSYPLVRFCELPLGARFMYQRGKREFVVLEHGGRSKVADVDHGPRTPMQGVYSFGSESDQEQLVVRTDVVQEPTASIVSGGHNLYTDADRDRPAVICDSNGSVALSLCKDCGRGEAELDLDSGVCPKKNVRTIEQQAEDFFNLTLKAQDLGFGGINEALNELQRRILIAKPANRENGWRASHYIEPNSGKVKMILVTPDGANVVLTYDSSRQDSMANYVITKFTHDFCGIPDAGFTNVNDFTAFLRGLVEYDAAGLPTANPWEFGNVAADAVDAQFSVKPADWMRSLVLQEMRERLALPDGDEARTGPEEVLRELNAADRGTSRRDPAVWLTSEGRAFGRVSDEQIESVLLGALADVRARSGLRAPESPASTTYSVEDMAERIMQRAAEIAPPDSPNTDLRMGLKSIVQALIEGLRGELG